MPTPPFEPTRLGAFLTFATILLVVMILRIAEDVVVPIAISVLLAFLLSPVVNRLARWGLPEVLAVGLTATLAFSVLAGLGWVVATQAIAVAEDLPRHEPNIRAKIAAVGALTTGGSLRRTTGMVNSLAAEAQSKLEPEEPEPERRRAGEPVPVVIAGEQQSRTDMIARLLTPALGPIGTAGIVVIFVLFILFQRHDLRDRFVNVISAGRMNVATQAVDDAARRILRYLGMQLFVNATYGIPVAIGLYFIGVPGALLWGVLATVLRFIPFIGPWIAASFPVVLAAAVDPGWSMLAYTIALFVVLELVSNNVVEVLAYGTSTGISSFALLVAAVFWTWLWGPAGLFLSTPLTACVVVMGKYVPGLKFLSVVLGNEPSMAGPSLFFQRLLTMDFDGMLALARPYVKERSAEAFYDEVFIPALILAEEERHRGALAEVRQRFIVQAGGDLVDELSNDERECLRPETAAGTAEGGAIRVVLVPAGDEADELSCLMLQHVLECRGWSVAVSPLTTPHDACMALFREAGARLAIVAAVPPSAVTIARKVCRRLKRDLPEVAVVVGIWSPQDRAAELMPRLRRAGPEAVATSLGEAAALAQRLMVGPATAPEPPSGAPGEAVLQPADMLERIRRELAGLFDVPASLVKLADVDRAFWGAMPGIAGEVDAVGTALRDTPLAALVQEAGVIEVPDTRKDRRLAASRVLEERGVRYLACAPLRLAGERVVGLLLVVDTRVRTAGEEKLALLEARAADLMACVEASGTRAPADDRP